MLICGISSNKGFRSRKQNPYANHLYCGLPSRMGRLYRPYCFSTIPYCIYQYARGWFSCIHSSHLTLSMLVQLYYRKIQPFCTPPKIYCPTSLLLCQTIHTLSNRKYLISHSTIQGLCLDNNKRRETMNGYFTNTAEGKTFKRAAFNKPCSPSL